MVCSHTVVHQNCISTAIHTLNYTQYTPIHLINFYTCLTKSLNDMPPGLLKIDTLADRLVSKASQLIQNTTANLSENFISIRCKMDGGKFYKIQSGSFQH